MSSLPNPKDFNNFKIELSNRIEFDEMQQDYDLNNIYNSFKKNPIPAAKIGLNRTTMQELDRTQKRSLTGQ